MAERLCEYCRFEIPYGASVCGHCGKDNPLRIESRRCAVHGKDYEVSVSVRGYAPDVGWCPVCEAEKAHRAKIKEEIEKKIEKQITPLLQKRGALANDLYKLKLQVDPPADRSDWGINLFLVFPLNATLIAGVVAIVSAVAIGADFAAAAFVSVWLGVMALLIIGPFFTGPRLASNISNLEQEIRVLDDSIREARKGS
ncbi:MAG: hypothetical protein HZB55_13740 [Deltaproteobacteria bacterium]|nr:hypothetical protein [Deltaproteobacteria bacterium]